MVVVVISWQTFFSFGWHLTRHWLLPTHDNVSTVQCFSYWAPVCNIAFWSVQNTGWPPFSRPASSSSSPSASVSGAVGKQVRDDHHVSSSQRAGAVVDRRICISVCHSIRDVTWSFFFIGILTHFVSTSYTLSLPTCLCVSHKHINGCWPTWCEWWSSRSD